MKKCLLAPLRETSGTLFENVVAMLRSRYVDREFATQELPALADLQGVAYPTFGFQAIGAGDARYAGIVIENRPAARAGLLTGDRQEDGRSRGGRSLGRRGDSGDVW